MEHVCTARLAGVVESFLHVIDEAEMQNQPIENLLTLGQIANARQSLTNYHETMENQKHD